MTEAEHKRQREAIDLVLATFDQVVGGGPIPINAPGLRRRVLYEITSYTAGQSRDTSRLKVALQDMADWLADELVEVQKRRGTP